MKLYKFNSRDLWVVKNNPHVVGAMATYWEVNKSCEVYLWLNKAMMKTEYRSATQEQLFDKFHGWEHTRELSRHYIYGHNFIVHSVWKELQARQDRLKDKLFTDN